MGGEPLLHKDIVEIMKITRANFKTCKIKIVTNGILLETMPEDFFHSCRANNIHIEITQYPISLNKLKIAELGKRYGVTIKNYALANKKVYMRKMGLVLKPTQNKDTSFKNCQYAKYCHTIRDGKFFMCPPVAMITHFNKYFSKNLEVTPQDFVDIYRIKDINELQKYRKQAIPFCRYCNFDKNDKVIWTLSKKDISEWSK